MFSYQDKFYQVYQVKPINSSCPAIGYRRAGRRVTMPVSFNPGAGQAGNDVPDVVNITITKMPTDSETEPDTDPDTK